MKRTPYFQFVLLMLLLGVADLVCAKPKKIEDVYLGSRTFLCAKNLRVHGKRSVYYPVGKSEWITIPVKSDVIVYECGYRRARLICAIHSSRIMIRRSSSRGSFEVKCYGPPPRLPFGESAQGGATAGEGAPAAGGAPPP
jgi:hypothetical protein